MKTKKIPLDVEDDNEAINLGLVRLAKAIPEHEFFFHLNTVNAFAFHRISDLVYHGSYYDFYFSRYQTFYKESEICLQCISNSAFKTVEQKKSTELFTGEEEHNLLLPQFADVDFLLTASEPFIDFSLILHPENLLFPLQDYRLNPWEDLYQLIQYYE